MSDRFPIVARDLTIFHRRKASRVERLIPDDCVVRANSFCAMSEAAKVSAVNNYG